MLARPGENDPPGQDRQVEAPVWPAYDPAWQSAQIPSTPYRPTSHGSHVTVPTNRACVPFGQAWQAPTLLAPLVLR